MQLDAYLRTNLKTRHLRLLVALDQFHGIRLVADHLHVTQPAVSKALSELEKGLGVILFERTSMGLSPNAYGKCLIRYAKNILKEVHQANDELLDLVQGTSGRVSIGAMQGVISTLLPAALTRMKALSPATTVSIKEGTLNGLIPDLRKGDLDMVVGRLPWIRSDYELKEKILIERPVMLVVRRTHPLVGKENLGWRDLQGYPWVLPPRGALLRDPLERELERHGVPMPNDYIETLSVHLTLAYLQSTDAIACLAGHVANTPATPDLVDILPLRMPALIGRVGITWNGKHTLSPSARLLFECLEASVQDAGKAGARKRRDAAGPTLPGSTT
ncbi:HTH-type transcriptional regulator GbpR [Pigmentiphaga humi]|uniref:HTH-type transcriptional regulator GbpR n=1 Tax=Pigmentiphaga humi TaxID=2478468 RepID=A0A3P4AVV5_9BURK|nr:LysR substrate-binding domain-containing protein [Pigmentiphaga humi]VCU68184.1 HTH-type transcriptional regulator GbpR [Pigmentiphaga humi]